MTLQQSGVQLVVQDQSAFLQALAAANGAVNALGVGSASAAQKIDQLSTRIEFQKRSLGILAQELTATATKYGEGSVQAQKKQLALDKLTASIAKDEAALADLRAAEAAAAASSAQLAQGLDKAGQSSSRFGEIATGALRRVGEIAVNVLGSAVQAVGAFISSSVDQAGDYEQAMDVMAAQSGATADQMDQVGATAKALGADLTLPATSAVDAGNAMLELSKGGLDVAQSMAAAKGTLQLAAAAETDVATAANITTGALSAFQLAGDQSIYVSDLLTNAANKSRASITDLAQGFQQAAFRMHSAGQGADDLAASLAILINKGLSGSDAGTALQNAIARLQGPTQQAAALMHQLGINVYDASGNMLPMEGIIGVLNGAFKGMTQQQRNAALQTIFLSDGMKAMIPLLDAGSDGFLKMKDEVNQSGAASRMAGAQMQGLKGAVAGLSSQIETLALEAMEPLLPIMAGVVTRGAEIAGSFVGKVGPAVKGTIDVLGHIAGVINTVFFPALGALGAATLLYGLTQLPVMITALGTATTALGTNAAAMIASLGPYALVAVTIGLAVVAWQKYQAEVDRVTQKVLDGSQAWKDGTQALNDYAAAAPFVQQATSAQATGLAAMRTEQEAAVRALVEYVAKNGEGTEQEARMREAINARGQAIIIATGQLRDHIVALDEGKLHGTDAIENLRSQRVAQDTVTEGIRLSDEELDKLAKKLEEVYKGGALAVQDYVLQSTDFLQKSEQSHAEHQDRLTALYAEKNKARTDDARAAVQARIDAENVGYAQQETNAALAYARQAGAQRAHLGDMLSDYTVTQVQLGRISVEQGDAILGQIEHQFGTTQAISARTFGQMEQTILHAAQSGGESLNNLGGDLGHVADRAITTKEKMDALEKKYTMQLVENTPEALRHTQAYLDKLAQIPAYVRTVVELEEHRMSEHAGMAAGGPVTGGQTYTVGERQPETYVPNQGVPAVIGLHGQGLFTPQQSGYILPSARMSPPASPAQIMNRTSTTTYNQQRVNNYQYAPTYAQTPRAPAVDFATMAAFGS